MFIQGEALTKTNTATKDETLKTTHTARERLL